MTNLFPKTIHVSLANESSEEPYLSAHDNEMDAITATDDAKTARVATYELVSVQSRTIKTSVVDAK